MNTTNNSGTGSSQSSYSHSEVGHVKNVANFNVLLNICLGFGTNYNPSNSHITTTAMQTLYPQADSAVSNSTNLTNSLQQNINSRLNAFVDLKPTATRILAALIACGADAETIKNAKTINRKIQGRRAVAIGGSNNNTGDGTGGGSNAGSGTSTNPLAGNEKQVAPPIVTQPINISVSQQSFDRFVANLKALVNYVSQVAAYNPNESDLKIASLTAYLATLQAANNAVIAARVSLNSSLVIRTKTLYDPLSGLVQIAFEVKQYVVSIFGARSMEAKQVNHVRFRTLISKPRKKHN